MISYPVENEDPTIKESPILPRRHCHIVEETEAKSLQVISSSQYTLSEGQAAMLNLQIQILINYTPLPFQHGGQEVLQGQGRS